MRAIKPKKRGIARKLEREIRRGDQVIQRIALDMLDRTCRDWVDKPGFRILRRFFGNNLRLVAQIRVERPVTDRYRTRPPAHLKWLWTNHGTRGHRIAARRAKQLAFRAENVPDTPRNFRPAWSQGVPLANGRKRGEIVRVAEVNHPGTTARNFSGEIHDLVTPLFFDEGRAALARAVRG